MTGRVLADAESGFCFSSIVCLRGLVIGAISLVLLGFYIQAGRRMIASSKASRTDLSFMAASALQLFLGSIHFVFLQDGVELVLFVRLVKTLQAVAVFALFFMAIDPTKKKIMLPIFLGLNVYFLVLYTTMMIFWRPKPGHCRDWSWVFSSASWFLISLALLALVPKLSQNLTSLLISHSSDIKEEPIPERLYVSPEDPLPNSQKSSRSNSPNPSISDNSSLSADFRMAAADIRNIPEGPVIAMRRILRKKAIEEDTDQIYRTKIQRLLALVLTESVCALVTLAWDVILLHHTTTNSQKACHFFLASHRIFETILFLLTTTTTYIVPHIIIFYVFYWCERQMYEPHRDQWDINLLGVEKHEVKLHNTEPQHEDFERL